MPKPKNKKDNRKSKKRNSRKNFDLFEYEEEEEIDIPQVDFDSTFFDDDEIQMRKDKRKKKHEKKRQRRENVEKKPRKVKIRKGELNIDVDKDYFISSTSSPTSSKHSFVVEQHDEQDKSLDSLLPEYNIFNKNYMNAELELIKPHSKGSKSLFTISHTESYESDNNNEVNTSFGNDNFYLNEIIPDDEKLKYFDDFQIAPYMSKFLIESKVEIYVKILKISPKQKYAIIKLIDTTPKNIEDIIFPLFPKMENVTKKKYQNFINFCLLKLVNNEILIEVNKIGIKRKFGDIYDNDSDMDPEDTFIYYELCDDCIEMK